MDREPVTLIATVRNEAASIDRLLDSVLAGTRQPDEIVIADGGSSDGTFERLEARAAADPRIRAVLAPGNRSVGRNAAIRAARSPIIACTDAGVEVEPQWLERITRPFERDPETGFVAGFYEPAGTTWFERAAGVISAPRLSEVDPRRFLPSTRSVAFRRSAWERAGGFDESLSHNEDTPFALALKRMGTPFVFEPEARVRWRPRGDLRSFYRQHRRFGFGDGESRVQGWFYATLAAKYALGAALALLGVSIRAAWWVLAAGAAAFVVGQARRGAGRVGILEAVVAVPSLKIVYDTAYLTGYLRGRLSPRPSSPASPLPGPGSPPVSD
ncbi:MAG: glycosyltransferase [Candidatus Latescibacteria bacterium]|nr:glycosyltransferase [Candidatus Latescibacterota bacterium]